MGQVVEQSNCLRLGFTDEGNDGVGMSRTLLMSL